MKISILRFGVIVALIAILAGFAGAQTGPAIKRQPSLAIKITNLTPVICDGDKLVWQYELTNLTPAVIEFDEDLLYGNYNSSLFRDAEKYGLREVKPGPNWNQTVIDNSAGVVIEPNATLIKTLTWPAGSGLVTKTGRNSVVMFLGGGASNVVSYDVFDCGPIPEREQQP